jgi:hypothetical protein
MMIWRRTIPARKRLSLLLGLFLAATCASQALAETYVILSVFSDHLTIVGMGAQLGSHINQNRHQTIQVTGTPFDDFAVRVADAIIAKARPAASVVALRAIDPELYKLRDSWLDVADVADVLQLMAFVPESVARSADTRLLLIAPYRDELKLKTAHDLRGAGKVAGLGFYLDTITRLRRSDTMESAVGYLGVFANFQLMLINLQSGAIDAHERIVLGTTRSAARAEDRTAWNALTQEQKTKVLESLLKEGIEGSLPRMLSSKT